MECTETLKEETERLWNCYNAIRESFLSFGDFANKANAFTWVEDNKSADVFAKDCAATAEKYLAEIEDAIKRFRGNRKQAYEEEPED